MPEDTTSKTKRRLDTPFSAIVTALSDIRDTSGLTAPSPRTDRMDGKVCLVTGASSGLGRAIATELAHRGAHLILAVRSGIPHVGEAIKADTGNPNIEMRHVDLSDLESVDTLADNLIADGVQIDRLILNAGLMAPNGEQTPQGFEQMFAVHFLANQRLATRLVEGKAIAKVETGERARIVAVSSEAHRSAGAIDMATFGAFKAHHYTGAMKQYGHTKLALNLSMKALSEQLTNIDGSPSVSVFYMCPGPVNSRISRRAPLFIRPLVKLTMDAFFPSPEKAAQPVIYLACSPEIEGETGHYMHLMRRKAPSDTSLDPKAVTAVWDYGEHVFRTLKKKDPA